MASLGNLSSISGSSNYGCPLDRGKSFCEVEGWVRDKSYLLYQSPNCSFVDSGFRCSENGWPDGFFTKWHWQPKDCNLPSSPAVRLMLSSFSALQYPYTMSRAMPWTEQVDVISSDECSSSDSDIDVGSSHPGKQLLTNDTVDQPTKNVINQTLKDMTSEGVLIKRAELYQDYMKQIPVPTHRGSLIPFTSWVGLGKSIKKMYGQPLHYLTNVQLKQWDQLRIGSEDEDRPLDTIVHPVKAEATIWLLEEVHRRTASKYHIAKLWLSDPMHHAFVDSIFPQL